MCIGRCHSWTYSMFWMQYANCEDICSTLFCSGRGCRQQRKVQKLKKWQKVCKPLGHMNAVYSCTKVLVSPNQNTAYVVLSHINTAFKETSLIIIRDITGISFSSQENQEIQMNTCTHPVKDNAGSLQSCTDESYSSK